MYKGFAVCCAKWLVVGFWLVLLGQTAWAAFPDFPHDSGHGVDCMNCHSYYAVFDPDTQGDDLCLNCHDGYTAPGVQTHSSATTSNKYGDWTISCSTCHNQHSQEQFRTYGEASAVFSGFSDTLGITANDLTMTGADWTPGEFAGMLLVPNLTADAHLYRVSSNTSTTISVEGTMDLEAIGSGGAEFAVIYGQFLRASINTPNSDMKTVRFFNATGANSFADGDASYDGVCEVCHTQTSHFNNTGTALDQLHDNYGGKAGTNCVTCHSHQKGFAGGSPAAPHDTQPFLDSCGLCHVTDTDYATKVPDSKCNQCHTPGGAMKASFPTAPNVITHSDANGSGRFPYSFGCVDCHTLMGTPTNLKLVSSMVAGSVVPGSFIEYTSLSGPGSLADGAPQNENICETCHQQTNHHWYNGGAPADNDIIEGYIGHYDGSGCCTDCHSHANNFRPGSDSCSSCHGNPPVTASIGGPDGLVDCPTPTGSLTAGAHAKHASALPQGYGYDCSACHFGGMDEADLVLDNILNVDFSIFGFNGVGSIYDSQILDLPFIVADSGNGTTVTSGNSMTCSNIYCHSDGTAVSTRFFDPATYPGPDNVSPSWDAQGPLGCNSCHDYPPAYGHLQPKNNAHARHVQILGNMGEANSCHVCHYSTTTNGTTITNPGNHANGQYDVMPNNNYIFRLNQSSQYAVDFDYSYDPGSSTCSNISCHTNLISTTHTWGYGSLTASPNTMRPGNVCGEVLFGITVSGGYPYRTPPYVYYIDWGDGTSYEGPDASHSHIYDDHTTAKSVTWTVRDANRLTMLNSSVPTPKTHTIDPFSGNADPVPDYYLYIDGYTVTFIDLSTDADYNTCGHSGPGSIRIDWGDYSSAGDIYEPIDLTDVPSGRQWSHTYDRARTINGMRHYVMDNGGSWWVIKEPFINFAVPQNPPITVYP